jgi:cyclophilin family peptidyl-prolyl cis-trans isomerase
LGKAEKRARKKQGRQARIEAETKAAERRRRRNLNIGLGVVVVIAAGFLGYHFLHKSPSTRVSTTSGTPTATATASAGAAAGAAPTPSASAACSTAAPTQTATPVSQSTPPPMTISAAKTYTATIDTSCGAFTVALDPKDTPNGVNSFVYLADRGFFNGLTFHRIVHNFAIQGGDPKGDGTGGPGYQVTDTVAASTTYSPGTVAFANAGTTGGAGSQFFVVPDAPNVASNYQPRYSVLGHVTSGLDTTVAKLNDVPTVTNSQGEKSQPSPKVYIYSITISTS